jgi:DNA-binding NarL/FixJ family response regulator
LAEWLEDAIQSALMAEPQPRLEDRVAALESRLEALEARQPLSSQAAATVATTAVSARRRRASSLQETPSAEQTSAAVERGWIILQGDLRRLTPAGVAEIERLSQTGMSNKAIARALGITGEAVRKRRHELMKVEERA